MSAFLSQMTGGGAEVWVEWPGGPPSFPRAKLAGSDRTANLFYFYQRNEADDASNMQATYGGVATTARYYRKFGTQFHLLHFVWDEDDIAANGDTQIVVTSNGPTPPGRALFYLTQGTAAASPFASHEIYHVDSGGQSFPVSMNNAAGLLQVAVWMHAVTSNREFTTDPDFTEHSNQQITTGFAADFGCAYNGGGESNFTLTMDDGPDTSPTVVLGAVYADPTSPGLSVDDVNGDNKIRRGETVTVNAQNAADVTSIELEGIEQGNTTDETLTVTDIGGGRFTLEFEPDFDGSPDLTYGVKTDGLTLIGDAGGPVDHTVDLLPPTGWNYLTVAGYPPTPPAISILAMFNDPHIAAKFGGFAPFVAVDGDFVEYEETTSLGFSVTMGADGVPIIGGGGTLSQYYKLRVYHAGQWTQEVTRFLNYRAVITSVAGAAGSSGKVNLLLTDVEFLGDHFGFDEGDAEIWAMPGKDQPLDLLVGVKQPDASYHDDGRRVIPSIDDGGGVILAGSDVTWHMVPGGSSA